MAAKPKEQLPSGAVSGLARDRSAPMVSLKAKKSKKVSRGK